MAAVEPPAAEGSEAASELELPEGLPPEAQYMLEHLVESGRIKQKFLQGIDTLEQLVPLLLSMLTSMGMELQCVDRLLAEKKQQVDTLCQLNQQLLDQHQQQQEQLRQQQRGDSDREAIVSGAVAQVQKVSADICAAVAAALQQGVSVLDPAVQQVFTELPQFLQEFRQLLAVSPKHSISAQSSGAAGAAAPPSLAPVATGAQQQSGSAHSVPVSSSSGATTAADPAQSARSSSSGSGSDIQRIKSMFDSIPTLEEGMPVRNWSAVALTTLRVRVLADLISRVGMSEQEQVLLLRGRIGKTLTSGLLSSLPVSDMQSPAALIAALESALVADETGLERAMRALSPKSDASAQQIAVLVEKEHKQFRVPLPEKKREYRVLLLSFPEDVQRFMHPFLHDKDQDSKYTWFDFKNLCAEYDQRGRAADRQQRAAAVAKQQQSQQQPPQQQYGGRQQQSGGKQVRFSPSANGAAFEEELPRSPPPQQQRGRGGFGKGKGGGNGRGGSRSYDDAPPDYGGHYGAPARTAAGLQCGRLAGGVLGPSFRHSSSSLGCLGRQAPLVMSSSRALGPQRFAGGMTFLGSQPRAAAAVRRPLSGASLGSLLVTGQPLGRAAGVSSSTSGLSEITPADDSVSATVGSSPVSSSSRAAAAGATSSGDGGLPDGTQRFPSLQDFFTAVAASTSGPTLRRRPRGAEPVVPAAPADAAAPQPAATQETDPALVRLRHQLSNVQLPMMLRTLIAAISSPEFQSLREGLCQLGQALELPSGVSAPAAVGGVFGALAAAAFAEDGTALPDRQPPAGAVAAVQQPSGSPAGIACGSVRFSSMSGTAGSTQHDSSSSSSSGTAGPLPPATPYKDAVDSEVVTVPFTSPFKITGGILGRVFSMVVDIGCCTSVMDLSWLRRNQHIFFYPGSPVQLLSFEQQAPSLGVMLGGTRSEAVYVLRNVPLELGEGTYNVNFLVMPHSSFDVALGLEFVDTYAVQVAPKAYGVPNSKPQLVIPTPRSFCHTNVQKRWQSGWRWYNNCVPASFGVGPERYSASVVDPRVLWSA